MIFTTTKAKSSCCDDDSGCSTSPKAVHSCPSCKKYGLKINQITLKAQLKKEYFDKLKTPMDQFNFCSNPICDIVYYSNDNSKSYNQSQVKSKITIKNNDPKTPLCYCKKILKQDVLKMIENHEENIAKKIKDKISEGKSFCEKSNPKGSCCISEVKDFLAKYNMDF